MKHLKKALAAILCVVLIVTTVPLNVFAESGQPESDINTDDFQVSGSNALGKEIGTLMSEQHKEQNADYSISRMDVDGKTATVEMYNKSACTVVVAVFEENGRMVGSGKTEVEADTAYASVELNIPTMPEYFVAKAYLLDDNMASLCDEFTSERNTKNYQEFMELTVEDFEGMIVVSLEEDSANDGELVVQSVDLDEAEPQDNNFFVAKEGTHQIFTDGINNILVSKDDETGVYVFENADRSITGLNAGETFFYDCGNSDFILAVVDSVETEGDLTTVISADAEIYDLFECIKLEEEVDATKEDVVEDSLGEGVTFNEIQTQASSFDSEIMKINTHLKFVYDNDEGLEASFAGDLSVKLRASSYFYYHIKLLGKNKVDFWFKLTMWQELDMSVSAEYSFSKDIELYCVEIPVYAGISVKTDMSVNLSFSGELHLFVGRERTVGFSFKTGEGFNQIKEDKDWSEPWATLEGSVSVSFEMGVGVVFVKVLHLTLNFSVGVEVTASATVNNIPGDAPRHHECKACISISADLVFGASFDLKIGVKRWKASLVDVDIAKITVTLGSWYYSVSSENKTEHGFGECENWTSRVYFYVVDTNRNPIGGVSVDGVVTDENGNCSKLYRDGEHNITVSKDGYLPTSTSFTIDKKPIDHLIMLTPVMMTGISVKTLPAKTSYYTGDTLDTTGLAITTKYNNGKTETITSGFSVTPTKLTVAGTQTITVDYNGFKTTFNVSVTQLAVTKLEVKTPPAKTEYFVGETVDTTGLVLTETYNNGVVKTITSGYTVTPDKLTTPGRQAITVTYGGKTCTYSINVTPVVATGISVKTLPSKTDYFVGDMLDTTGLVLEETYNNGDVVTVTSGYTCTPSELVNAGEQTVTVTYGDNTCAFVVNVIPVVATGISVKTLPSKTEYFVGDVLDTTGLILEETYNSGNVAAITSGYTCTPLDLIDAGTQTVMVTYGENQCEFDVEVIPVVATKIEIVTRPDKTIYFTGDTLDTTGLTLKETYNNGDIVTVTSGYTCTPETLSTAGTQNITVTYGGNSCTYVVDVYDSSECSGVCGDNLIWTFDPLTGLLSIKGTGSMYDWYGNPENVPWKDYRDAITDAVVGDGITSIGDEAFYKCTQLKSVSLPEGLKEIGYHSFVDCSSLENITIPQTVTYIQEISFSNCSSLTNITLPSGIKGIYNYTFQGCSNLENVIIPEGVTLIGVKAFANCKKLININIPDSVTSIGSSAFYGCTSLAEVTIGNGVTSILDDVFWNCSGLTSITVDSKNTAYSNDAYGALFNKDKTVLIQYPAGNARKSYTVPNGVTSIRCDAFYNCDNITSITIPNSVISIDGSFYDCDSLTGIIIPDGVTSINNGMFMDCDSLASVKIGKSVTSIGRSAFENCSSFTSVIIENKVTNIGLRAFYYCNNLTDVYYTGTEDEWKAISIGDQNEALTSATIHYNYVPSGTQNVINVTQTVGSAKSIAPPLIPVYPTDSSVKKVMVSNAVVGNRYTLIALDQTESEYSLDNLVFIDNMIAAEKSFWLSFMPRSFDNPIVLVIGDFGSGIEQKRFKVYDGTAVDSITLSDSALEMYMGQEPVQLSYEITPEPVEIKTVLWSSDNNAVAQVDGEGNVYPCAPGKATITATTAQGGVTASCEVTVIERVFEISWILADKTVTEEVTEGYSIAEYADTERYGYSFIGWSPAVPNRMPGNNLSFTAVYEPVICNVLFDANGGLWSDGTTEAITSSVAFDTEITAPQNPSKQGYIFSGWSLDGENTGTDTGIMNDVDGKEFIAVWIPATDTRYTVETYVMNTEGEYEMSSQIYSGTTDETVYTSYNAEDGFALNDEKSILSGVVKGDNSLVLKVYIDRNIYKFTTVSNGTSTSTDYLYGSMITEPSAPSKTGYKFVGWDNEIPSTMPAEDVTITAEFVKAYTCPDCGNEILGEDEINAHIAAEAKMKVTVEIKNNTGSKTISYGERLRLTAITTNMPTDAKIYWYIDDVKQGEGETFDVSFDNGTKTVEVKIVDSNGNVLKDSSGNEIKDSESVTVKGGFFQKIISFFKNLFGMNRTIIQTVFRKF